MYVQQLKKKYHEFEKREKGWNNVNKILVYEVLKNNNLKLKNNINILRYYFKRRRRATVLAQCVRV